MAVKQGAALAIAASVVVSCGQTAAVEQPEEPPLDAVVMSMEAASIDPRAVSFPLSPYIGEEAGLGAIGQALDILQLDCLRRFGIDLPLPDRTGARSPLPTWDWYGLWEEETAAVFGYRTPPLEGASSPLVVPREGAQILAGELEEFNGERVPDGGCQGESYRALGVEDDGGLVDVGSLQRDAVTRARQHDDVEALIGGWSDCLATAGWEYSEPSQPFVRWDGGAPGDPTTEEIEMAMADISCKKESGLLQAWVAAEVSYQRIMVEENASALRELQEWRDAARRRANDVIAGDI